MSTKVERIPDEVLQRARRKLCRKIAAVLIDVMAETDADYAFIASRLDQTEESVREQFARLIEGREHGLSALSDMAVALHCEIVFRARPIVEVASAPASPEEAQRSEA